MLNKEKGFSLLELLITLVIISILAFMGMRSYKNIILKTRRLDAKTSLLAYQQSLQSCFIKNREYETCFENIPDFSVQGFYKINFSLSSPNRYSLFATAENSQKEDLSCYQFLINEQNALYAFSQKGQENSHCW